MADGPPMRDHGPWLLNPSAHGHFGNCDAFGIRDNGAVAQNLAKKANEDGDEGKFDGFGKCGAEQRSGRGCKGSFIHDLSSIVGLCDGQAKPDGRKDGRVDGEKDDGDVQPIGPSLEEVVVCLAERFVRVQSLADGNACGRSGCSGPGKVPGIVVFGEWPVQGRLRVLAVCNVLLF